MNRRTIGVLLVMLVLIILICLSLYALNLPRAYRYKTQIEGTSNAKVTLITGETQTAFENLNATATAAKSIALAQDLAATQTQQAIPPTPTSIPASSSCQGKIMQDTILLIRKPP
jgi:hypothetical protein